MNNFNLCETQNGIILNLHVIPNASKTQLAGIYNGFLKIKISAAPEDGKANKELIKFLSKLFNMKKSDFIIIKGEKSREKQVLIKNQNSEYLKNMIMKFLNL
jgi:uncharacterized protein (TIGR00251 family)